MIHDRTVIDLVAPEALGLYVLPDTSYIWFEDANVAELVAELKLELQLCDFVTYINREGLRRIAWPSVGARYRTWASLHRQMKK